MELARYHRNIQNGIDDIMPDKEDVYTRTYVYIWYIRYMYMYVIYIGSESLYDLNTELVAKSVDITQKLRDN